MQPQRLYFIPSRRELSLGLTFLALWGWMGASRYGEREPESPTDAGEDSGFGSFDYSTKEWSWKNNSRTTDGLEYGGQSELHPTLPLSASLAFFRK